LGYAPLTSVKVTIRVCDTRTPAAAVAVNTYVILTVAPFSCLRLFTTDCGVVVRITGPAVVSGAGGAPKATLRVVLGGISVLSCAVTWLKHRPPHFATIFIVVPPTVIGNGSLPATAVVTIMFAGVPIVVSVSCAAAGLLPTGNRPVTSSRTIAVLTNGAG